MTVVGRIGFNRNRHRMWVNGGLTNNDTKNGDVSDIRYTVHLKEKFNRWRRRIACPRKTVEVSFSKGEIITEGLDWRGLGIESIRRESFNIRSTWPKRVTQVRTKHVVLVYYLHFRGLGFIRKGTEKTREREQKKEELMLKVV